MGPRGSDGRFPIPTCPQRLTESAVLRLQFWIGTMNIDVWLFGRFRELATRQLIVSLESGARLGDLIEWLIKEYGIEFGEEIKNTKNYAIMRNKRYCDLSTHWNKALKDGDVVAFMPIVAGG